MKNLQKSPVDVMQQTSGAKGAYNWKLAGECDYNGCTTADFCVLWLSEKKSVCIIRAYRQSSVYLELSGTVMCSFVQTLRMLLDVYADLHCLLSGPDSDMWRPWAAVSSEGPLPWNTKNKNSSSRVAYILQEKIKHLN